MTKKKTIEVEKSDKKSHHDNTPLKKNIVQMFFKTPKKRFLAQKNVRFLSSFFNRAKEANRMIGSNFTRPPFSSACKAPWGDDAIWFLALAACAQFRFFY